MTRLPLSAVYALKYASFSHFSWYVYLGPNKAAKFLDLDLRVSNELKGQFPKIPWREISGFRNILVHDYLGIDCDAIWSVVVNDLPEIKAILLQMKS